MDVRTLCLGALARGPATGYEIRKQFEQGPFGHFQEAAFASIYPSLKRLAEDGLIAGADEPRDGADSRDRFVYRITPAGRQALYDALMRPPGADKVRSDFLFIAFFGHWLPAHHLDRLIGERIAWLRATIERMESRTERPMESGHAFALGYGLAVYRAAAEYLEAHRAALVGAASAPGARVAE
ncbi:PadR family transcriptional regulator [Azospirillum sp. ST 5-10]|uniref:PadR family transcriptional regulator n=1 Tax=unclassified Azospirillum TaxID=2630922 RepID=UPI003F49C428